MRQSSQGIQGQDHDTCEKETGDREQIRLGKRGSEGKCEAEDHISGAAITSVPGCCAVIMEGEIQTKALAAVSLCYDSRKVGLRSLRD